MQELRKHNYITDSEVDTIKTNSNDVANQPCITNKVSYLIAFWFDLPTPNPNQGNFQRRIYNVSNSYDGAFSTKIVTG